MSKNGVCGLLIGVWPPLRARDSFDRLLQSFGINLPLSTRPRRVHEDSSLSTFSLQQWHDAPPKLSKIYKMRGPTLTTYRKFRGQGKFVKPKKSRQTLSNHKTRNQSHTPQVWAKFSASKLGN